MSAPERDEHTPTTDIDGGDRRECRHEESLYGRCVSCGMTWDQQAETDIAGCDGRG